MITQFAHLQDITGEVKASKAYDNARAIYQLALCQKQLTKVLRDKVAARTLEEYVIRVYEALDFIITSNNITTEEIHKAVNVKLYMWGKLKTFS